jgi:bifunctional non-homologous end joining protein LigD
MSVTAKLTHRDLMLASSAKVPFIGSGWLWELKYDGFRCLATKKAGKVRLESRNGRDMSASFPELVDAFRSIQSDLVVDGELVICDALGRPVFERLKTRAAKRKPESIRKGAAEDPAAMFAFDLLWLNGEDYRHFPLTIRKAMLAHTLKGSRCIKYAEHFENSPAELWAIADRLELEGIVGKRMDSTYTAGRSNSWQKIKTAAGADRERQRGRG